MKSYPVQIDKLVNGGYGLGRLEDGQVVLAQNGLPGEKIVFREIEKRKKTLFGLAEEILSQPNPARIKPPCPYYSTCGGCNLQHCNYDTQLSLKGKILQELLSGLHLPASRIFPMIPSPEQFGYRQRIRLQVANGKVGFLRYRSKQLVPIKKCLLAHSAINETLIRIQDKKEFNQLLAISEEVELLFNPALNKVNMLFHCTRKIRPADKKKGGELSESIDLIGHLFFTGKTFSMESGDVASKESLHKLLTQSIHIESLSKTVDYSWEMGGFCQVNLEQNAKLIQFIVESSQPLATKKVLDLYCGMGNFSLPLAICADMLLGVEGQRSAIRSAKYNSLAAGLDNTQFIQGDIHCICEELLSNKNLFETVVIDPPRSGVPGLAKTLYELCSEKLIYISCDPATLARDLKDLTKEGYKIEKVQPFDMFPQTHHIETVTILTK